MTKITTRYVVKNRAGEELVVPSLDDLHALYAQGFLADEDLVRQERSPTWVRAGDLPALQGVRELERDPRKVLVLVATVVVVLVLLAGLLRFLSR